jgi:hypothetical protein
VVHCIHTKHLTPHCIHTTLHTLHTSQTLNHTHTSHLCLTRIASYTYHLIPGEECHEHVRVLRGAREARMREGGVREGGVREGGAREGGARKKRWEWARSPPFLLSLSCCQRGALLALQHHCSLRRVDYRSIYACVGYIKVYACRSLRLQRWSRPVEHCQP